LKIAARIFGSKYHPCQVIFSADLLKAKNEHKQIIVPQKIKANISKLKLIILARTNQSRTLKTTIALTVVVMLVVEVERERSLLTMAYSNIL